MSEAKTQLTVSSEQVSKYLNTPIATIKHWCKQDVLGEDFTSPGRGRGRRYTADDVAAMAIVSFEMNQGGRSYMWAKEHARNYRDAVARGVVERIAIVFPLINLDGRASSGWKVEDPARRLQMKIITRPSGLREIQIPYWYFQDIGRKLVEREGQSD